MPKRFFAFFCLFLLISCEKGKDSSSEGPVNKPARVVSVPLFNPDSAFYFVKRQVDFGPRIPNTEAHRKTADFLSNQLRKYGATVTVQEFDQTTYDNQRVRLKNIIASFYPETHKRVLLAAHWDTRPFADRDKQNPDAPFDGANDGASGVGVLLEIARTLSTSPNPPDVGVDIILFDGEDWGERVNERLVPTPKGLDSWWCLGSQYWSTHKHKPNYSAFYGILLDMVGAKNSQFYREGLSLTYAPKVVDRVWTTADQLGYSRFFVKKNQSEIIDDHKYVTENAKIPMIDIVNHDPATGWFGFFHHTHADNMDLISEEPLKAVGETLLHVVYYEEPDV
jgi:Peptidase family M28